LDSGILTLHFAGDHRVKEFFDLISDGRATGLVAYVNIAEYYYKTCQLLGKQTADTRYYMLMASKLLMVQEESLTRLSGLEKCRQKLDLSLADCFALALAKREHATLLTTDSELKKTNEAQVKFFSV
jgi:predicted nucleic acid-binding protein